MQVVQWQTMPADLKKTMLTRHQKTTQDDLQHQVAQIIQTVKASGDQALLNYTQMFDGVSLTSLEFKVPKRVESSLKPAIDEAYKRIKQFHERQKPQSIECEFDGVIASKRYLPIENVGLYVPGGTAPLISTLLMLAIPAQIAACKNIVCVTPPNKSGGVDDAVLYAAKLCGIDTLYLVGGAQAVAALAYGTETIPKVDKIFGPGNKYVTQAKVQVSQDPLGAALDMPAGPSEVLVIGAKGANAQLIASDLLAQAEHDPDSAAIFVSTCVELAHQVQAAVFDQLQSLSRKNIILTALTHSYIVIAQDIEEAFLISNTYAPEHLILHLEDPNRFIPLISNAGSVFLGQWSSEALGDYASGPNHVLPTYGYAKNYSGLGVEAFMKSITFQEVSAQGLLALAPTVEALAAFEGLGAHKASVSKRRQLLESQKS